jgi:hypothetical protein
LFDFNDISYVGRLWCPEYIPDIEKFLAVTIFKMYYRSAKGGEKGDPNRNPWLAKMSDTLHCSPLCQQRNTRSYELFI